MSDEGGRSAREALGQALTELREAAGKVSYQVLAREVEGPTSVQRSGRENDRLPVHFLSDWFRGKSAPQDVDLFWRVVRALRSRAQDQRTDAGWTALLLAAQREGIARRGRREGTSYGERGNKSFHRRRSAPDLSEELRGRTAELRQLKAFAASENPGEPSYLWLRSPIGGGKTALLANLAKVPPPRVDVLSYFVPAGPDPRGSGTFLAEMARQMRDLRVSGGNSQKSPLTPNEWWELLDMQAERSVQNGRVLLFVVDGLDEEPGWFGQSSRGEGSIAALLPPSPRQGLRVLVSSRPTLRFPIDVPVGHPLRGEGVVCELRPYGAGSADHVTGVDERRAREELVGLRGSELGGTLVAFLAAARGGLRLGDLAELAGVSYDEAEQLLGSVKGRCVISANRDAETCVLGHDKLYEVARQDCDTALFEEIEQRLHGWADEWHGKGWPENTPRYLLTDYMRTLEGTARLESLVLDASWQLRLVAEVGRDEAFAQLVQLLKEPDLTLAAGLAATRTLLWSRPSGVSLDLLRMSVAAHSTGYARQLALTAPGALAKIVGLAVVAREAEVRELPGTREILEEAVQWAEREGRAASDVSRASVLLEELASVATEFILAGENNSCATSENSVPLPLGQVLLRFVLTHGASSWRARARVAMHLDLCSGDEQKHFTELVDYAEGLSRTTADGLVEAVEIWEVLEAEVSRVYGQLPSRNPSSKQVELKKRLRCSRQELIKRLERTHSSTLTHRGLASAGGRARLAAALAPKRGPKSKEFADRASSLLKDAFADPDALDPADQAYLRRDLSETLVAVVEALLHTDRVDTEGRVREARELLEMVPTAYRTSVFGVDVTEAADTVLVEAEAGEANRREADQESAETSLERHSREVSLAVEAVTAWLPTLAEAVAAVGDFEELDRLVAHVPDDAVLRTRLWASASLGCAHSGNEEVARTYARQAAELSSKLPDPVLRGVVAQALAHASDVERAVELASRMEPFGAMSKSHVRQQVRRSRAAVAVGVATRAPEVADEIVAQLATRLQTLLGSGRDSHLLQETMELLLGRRDVREPGEVLGGVLRECLKTDPQAPGRGVLLTHRLLEVTGFGQQNPQTPSKLELPGQAHVAHNLPLAETCVLRVLRGDADGVWETAGRATTAKRRAEALAAASAQLVRAPVTLAVVPDWSGWSLHDPAALRFQALAQALTADPTTRKEHTAPGAPTSCTAREEAEARGLVGEVLAGEHWQYALPLLPWLAPPQAVSRISALVRTHARHNRWAGWGPDLTGQYI